MYITATKDLINEYSVNIGADYELALKFCDNPDLTEMTGISDIRDTLGNLILNFTVEVVSKDILKLKILNTTFPEGMDSGTYVYDVLMTNTNTSEKLYLLAGKVQFIKRVTV